MAAPRTPKPKTILVVDDDADILLSITDSLTDAGYAVITALNGMEALERLRQGARPALILLDLMMPLMDGFEFLALRRREAVWVAIPVVILSADPSAREKAAAESVSGYLQKPIKLQRLLDTVAKYAV